MIRVWAVTAVTPVARVLEGCPRRHRRLRPELHPAARRARGEPPAAGRNSTGSRWRTIFLKTELNTADRAKALAGLPGAARRRRRWRRASSATGAGANSKVVFVDRGLGCGRAARHGGGDAGRHRGQGDRRPIRPLRRCCWSPIRISPPAWSRRRRQVHGTLKGQGHAHCCKVDYVPIEEKVEAGRDGSTPPATTASFPRVSRWGW